jgi:hypothetical protein
MDTELKVGSYSGAAWLDGGLVMVELVARREIAMGDIPGAITWHGVAFIAESEDTHEVLGSHVPLEVEGVRSEVAASGEYVVAEGVHEVCLTGTGRPPFEIAE